MSDDPSRIVDIATGGPVITPADLVGLLQDRIERADRAIVLLRVDGEWEIGVARCDLGEMTWAHRLFGITLDGMIGRNPSTT